MGFRPCPRVWGKPTSHILRAARLRSNLLLKARQRLIAVEFAIPFFVSRRTSHRATTARNTLSNGVANDESEHSADGQSPEKKPHLRQRGATP